MKKKTGFFLLLDIIRNLILPEMRAKQKIPATNNWNCFAIVFYAVFFFLSQINVGMFSIERMLYI